MPGSKPAEPVQAPLAAELLRVARPLAEPRVPVARDDTPAKEQVCHTEPTATVSSGAQEPSKSEVSWQFDGRKHPLVHEGEVAFISSCLQQLSTIISDAGGLSAFLAPGNRALSKLLGPSVSPDWADEDLIRRCLEAVLRKVARTGKEDLFVEAGNIMSFGEKKVVKVTVALREEIHFQVSVCWRWDNELQLAS